MYGDSNCLDSSHQRSSCFGMLQKVIEYAVQVRLYSAPLMSGTVSVPFPRVFNLKHKYLAWFPRVVNLKAIYLAWCPRASLLKSLLTQLGVQVIIFEHPADSARCPRASLSKSLLTQLGVQGKKDAALFSETSVLANALGSADMELPKRREDVDLQPFSTVLSQPLLCSPNAPLDFEIVTVPHRGASRQERVVRLLSLLHLTLAKLESRSMVFVTSHNGTLCRQQVKQVRISYRQKDTLR